MRTRPLPPPPDTFGDLNVREVLGNARLAIPLPTGASADVALERGDAERLRDWLNELLEATA